MRALLTLAGSIDRVNERFGRVAIWLVLLTCAVSAANAVLRYAFDVGSNAWLELQWYLFGAVFMLCASWTLKANEHIRIDIVSSRLSPRTRNIIDIMGHLFFLLPFVVLMIYLSIPFFERSFQSGEVSTNAGGLLIWPAKGLILLGFILLGFQWLSELIKRIAILRGELDDEHASGGHAHGTSAEAEAERLITQLHQENKTGELPGDSMR